MNMDISQITIGSKKLIVEPLIDRDKVKLAFNGVSHEAVLAMVVGTSHERQMKFFNGIETTAVAVVNEGDKTMKLIHDIYSVGTIVVVHECSLVTATVDGLTFTYVDEGDVLFGIRS